MYAITKIENKCYQIGEKLVEMFFVKAYENPGRHGWDIAIYESEKLSGTEPALGEFFLEETIAIACFENGNCSGWKELLKSALRR
jgi:hypothetical protein